MTSTSDTHDSRMRASQILPELLFVQVFASPNGFLASVADICAGSTVEHVGESITIVAEIVVQGVHIVPGFFSQPFVCTEVCVPKHS